VLDFGCGAGHVAAHLAGLGYQVTACDIAVEMLVEACDAFPAVEVHWCHVTPTSPLPAGDGTLDAVIASSVFEYMDGVLRVLAECHRVLRPGGVLLFTVPNPASGVRRLEDLVRPLAAAALVQRTCVFGRVGRFLAYLRLSHRRWSAARWLQAGESCGLQAAADGFVSPAPLLPRSLMLLALERPALADPAC
jgi:SAM-dependent methyltransferase